MEKYILFFNEISKDNTDLAGGKGASLGEMTQAGIPVPPGFVILADTFRTLIKANDLENKITNLIKNVNYNSSDEIKNTSETIRKLILNINIPHAIEQAIMNSFDSLNTEYVAVRSSATAEDSSSASWAGELETKLNIKKDSLLISVKQCWSSLFTPRAIFYRKEKGLQEEEVAVAVVIQKMVQSDISGIAFTADPVTNDNEKIVIEGGYGLGESIVGGLITPDYYLINKRTNQIEKMEIGKQEFKITLTEKGTQRVFLNEEQKKQQKLEKEKIEKLIEIIKKIENHYKAPQDIEWAIENNNIFIVQSRPITTISEAEEISKDEIVSLWKLLGEWFGLEIYNSAWLCYSNSQSFISLGLDKLIKGDMLDIKHNFYLLQEDFTKYEVFIENSYKAKNDYFNKLLKTSEKAIEEAIKLEGKDSISDFMKVLLELGGCSVMIYLTDMASGKYYQEICKKHNLIPETISAYIHPDKDTLFMKYTKELQELDVNNEENISLFLQKYYWIGTRFFEGEFLSKEKIINEKNNLNNKKRENAEKVNKFPEEIENYISIGKKLSYIRTLLFEVANRVSNSYRNPLKQLAINNNISYEKVLSLSFSEIIELDRKGQLPENLSKRKEIYGMSNINHQFRMILGQELIDKIQLFIQCDDDTKIIKGSVAYRGKIKGIVKVISSIDDLDKVKEGDILVASETTPDYIIAMRKAAAFVTDQGGVTSHAAIIAREMQKPCVIGTGKASRILKDNDSVEVDAINGLVRIIK